MAIAVEVPTRLALVPEFWSLVSTADSVALRLPTEGASRAPGHTVLAVVGNLLQHAHHLGQIELVSTHEDGSLARSLARAGFWEALHRAPAEVRPSAGSEDAFKTFETWDPDEAPAGQAELFPGELQWRPTTRADARSRRLEHRVGYIDRPDHRVAAYDNADAFASAMAEEIADMAAGAARDSLDDEVGDFSRLLARAMSTWVENVGEHAFDYDALRREERLLSVGRRAHSSLLVTLTRGGGSTETASRSSHNRIRLTVRDNGVSIPATVRGRRRLDGLTDSAAIVRHLLLTTAVGTSGQRDLKGLGYPELIELAQTCGSLGWSISLEIITQKGDSPDDVVIAVVELGGPSASDVVAEPKVDELRGAPFVGTAATITIAIPGSPDWLAGLKDA